MLNRTILALALGAAMIPQASHAQQAPIPIQDFVRHAVYDEARISPDGRFMALTAQQGEKTALVVMRMSDMTLLKTTTLPDDKSVGSFYWVGPERLMFTAVRNIGHYAMPFGTGEWFAIDADGGRPRFLISYGPQKLASAASIVHYGESFSMLDPMPDDGSTAMMQMSEGDPEARAEIVSIDTVTGRRHTLARAPRGSCTLVLDEKHTPRYANCFDSKGDNGEYGEFSELYRLGDDGQWTLVNRSKTNGRHIDVIGTAPDGRIYATSDDQKGPSAFGVLDRESNQFKVLYQDPVVDPMHYIVGSDGDTILGVITMAAAPHVEMVDKQSPDAPVYLSLANAFPGKLVNFSSATRDGNQIVVTVSGDSDPGELYLYNRQDGTVRFLLRNRSWLDPKQMASIHPFSFKTRDGLTEYGYLTVPKGVDLSKAAHLPMIVNPHGGPIGPRDDWGFNSEAQMFANRGYLVLQLNYRGSGGFGHAFQEMGHRQWGGKMQDDLTDVTHWAVDQGYADPNRICIYGGSYGGYAALMGVASQPDLYKCAVGYVGVYDMELMYKKGDISERESGKRFLRKTLGTDPADLQRRSPVHMADKIKAPVFLAAGGKDVRAPKEHTEEMRDALAAAGHPAEEVVIEPKEMHGFYDETANLNLYTKMLAFFDKYIGKGAATTNGSH